MLALLLAFGAPTALARRGPASQETHPYPLSRVEVKGLRLVPRARVLAIAGLRPGTIVTARDVRAATARLVASGLFASAAHRYLVEGHGLVVIFVLEEASWTTPVVFDNFVGYRDDELSAAVSAQLPLFRGSAPDQPAVLERIAGALRTLVALRHPSAAVTYVTATASARLPRRFRFRLELPSGTFPVCRVAVTGLPADAEPAAAERARALVGTEYSRDFVSEFAERSLVPVAQRGGHYLARIASASAEAAEGCDGVRVTIAVERGEACTWGSIRWVGADASDAEALARLLRVRSGELAEAELLQQTIDAGVAWYRDRGYLSAQVSPVVEVDGAGSALNCSLSVTAGERFRMGRLELAGLEDDLLSRIRAMWTLAAGDFYDGGYARRFTAQIRRAEAAALVGRTKIVISERADASTARVDVVLEFSR
jgi:outer membrane protein insertion porin family